MPEPTNPQESEQYEQTLDQRKTKLQEIMRKRMQARSAYGPRHGQPNQRRMLRGQPVRSGDPTRDGGPIRRGGPIRLNRPGGGMGGTQIERTPRPEGEYKARKLL